MSTSDRSAAYEPLWDTTFRARLLRQGLSNDEIAQAVEVAEAAAVERDRYRSALERILNRYHDRPLTGIDPTLPFQLKEIALKALHDSGFEEAPTDAS